jgi:hypothetical protein
MGESHQPNIKQNKSDVKEHKKHLPYENKQN